MHTDRDTSDTASLFTAMRHFAAGMQQAEQYMLDRLLQLGVINAAERKVARLSHYDGREVTFTTGAGSDEIRYLLPV